jgi:cation diffusion facilitator CzcD-associated flavoprotein CzcO
MTPTSDTQPLSVAIIGSGFGGLGMAQALRRAGIDNFVMLEKAKALGGTWRENTYPGAGCDVPSHLYSFSFEPHFPWARRYARQSQILEYLNHCADKYDLRRHIRFGCEVTAADFDEEKGLWRIQLASGESLSARVLVSAVGQLSRPAIPSIPGSESFTGTRFHSANWDHDHELDGKTVAVVGTGASAVQFVPEIAKRVKRLHVFQRSPGWTLPKVDTAFSPTELSLLRSMPVIHDLDRARIFGITELLGYATQGHPWAERLVTLLAKRQLRRQVPDPALRKRLTPDYPLGCKRVLLSNEWLPTLASPHVEVVTERIDALTPTGIRTADGTERAVDTIIYGTGFTANEFLAPMRITGAGGRSLHERWTTGAEAYLGMSVSGFPNLYVLYGPNTNLASGSIIYMLECQQRYIARMVGKLLTQGWRHVGVREEAQAAFVREVAERTQQTTISGNCQSWYKTADGRNTNNWIGLQREYAERTANPRLDDYLITA